MIRVKVHGSPTLPAFELEPPQPAEKVIEAVAHVLEVETGSLQAGQRLSQEKHVSALVNMSSRQHSQKVGLIPAPGICKGNLVPGKLQLVQHSQQHTRFLCVIYYVLVESSVASLMQLACLTCNVSSCLLQV